MWSGQTVAVLASGPSLSLEQSQQVAAAGIPAVVTNNTYQRAPGAALLYAADASWWHENREALAFPGLKVSAQDVPSAAVLTLRMTGADGYDPDPECLRTGGNSGYASVHIAAQAGAKRILLLGFDMRASGHWHGEHPKPLRRTPQPTYERWIARFEGLAVELAQRGVDVINCTPGSALQCFRALPLAAALGLP